MHPSNPPAQGTLPTRDQAGVYLYWIPLGAGARVVRASGKVYEAVSAFVQRRQRRDLYHSALVVLVGGRHVVIEMTPVPDSEGPPRRGVVVEGPVGTRWAGRFRVFRYEIRRWRNGIIPDLRFAVASPTRVTDNERQAQIVLDLVPSVPALVWGRDEVHAGEMWNSNSVVAWLLTMLDLVPAAGAPPGGGRAPGWGAGVVAGEAARLAEPLAGRR